MSLYLANVQLFHCLKVLTINENKTSYNFLLLLFYYQ